MSFILEALKKSEQQRQEKHVSQQQVRNRTLSLASSQPGRRPYWLLGFVSLALLCGWWFHSNQEPIVEQPLELSPMTSVPLTAGPPEEPVPVVTAPVPLESPLPQPVAVAESAPVPSIYVSPLPVAARATAEKRHATALQPQRVDVTPTKATNATEQVETVDMAQPQVIDARSLEPRIEGMPFYSELPGEMRDRMPPLAMSMHFFNHDPNRRLVRINDRLLHEGDLVSRELELVEITRTGVILDFMGKSFELRGSKR